MRLLTGSSKHRKHWIPFDRSKPPPWMDMGPVGIDDKRKLEVMR